MTGTWSSKLRRDRCEKRTVLTTAFAGIAPGSVLYVSTPQRLDAELRTVPPGTTITVAELRERLAAVNDADATCPTTTAIFLRIVAEAALEQHAAGAPLDEVTPFWRVVDPDSALARKLGCGTGFIQGQRAREATAAAAAHQVEAGAAP
jgi:hypothetical protein